MQHTFFTNFFINIALNTSIREETVTKDQEVAVEDMEEEEEDHSKEEIAEMKTVSFQRTQLKPKKY